MKKLEFENIKEDEDIQRSILAIDRSRELCMVKLVESVHYEIYKEYEKITNQWKEWYRDGSMWITNISLENDRLTMQMETGDEKTINIKTIF